MSSHTELTTLSNVVDFHDVDLSSPGDFKEFQKKMKENVTRAVFLQLRNAALKSEYSSALFTTLKRAVHLEALDVSNNSLRAPFEHALTDYLKHRKKTPQYLILHNNSENGIPTLFSTVDAVAGGGAVKAPDAKSKSDTRSHGGHNSSAVVTLLNDFVTSFTLDTWGICLTLPDFPFVIGNVAQKETVRKGHGSSSGVGAHAIPVAIADKEAEKTVLKLYDSANASGSHVPLTAEFLKRVNMHQHAQNHEEDAAGMAWVNSDAATHKAGAKKMTKASSAAPIKGLSALTAGRGLRNLNALGLRDTKLSKQSINLLEQTLLLSAKTLTDLDLSNSYIGFRGAKMLASVLGMSVPAVISKTATAGMIPDSTTPAAASGTSTLPSAVDAATTSSTVNATSNSSATVAATSASNSDNSSKMSRSTSNLISLHLGGNGMGDYGVKLLGQALRDNATVTYVDLTDNNLTDTGLINFIDTVKHNQILSNIILSDQLEAVSTVIGTGLEYSSELTSQSLQTRSNSHSRGGSSTAAVNSITVRCIHQCIRTLADAGFNGRVQLSKYYYYKPYQVKPRLVDLNTSATATGSHHDIESSSSSTNAVLFVNNPIKSSFTYDISSQRSVLYDFNCCHFYQTLQNSDRATTDAKAKASKEAADRTASAARTALAAEMEAAEYGSRASSAPANTTDAATIYETLMTTITSTSSLGIQYVKIDFDLSPFSTLSGAHNLTVAEVLPLYSYTVELQCTPSTDNNIVLHTGYIKDSNVMLMPSGSAVAAGCGTNMQWIRCVAMLPLHEFVYAMDTMLATHAMSQLRLVVLLNVNKHANTGAGTGTIGGGEKSAPSTLAASNMNKVIGKYGGASTTNKHRNTDISSHSAEGRNHQYHVGSNNILSNSAVKQLVQNVHVKQFVLMSTTVGVKVSETNTGTGSNSITTAADTDYGSSIYGAGDSSAISSAESSGHRGTNGSLIGSNLREIQRQNSTLGLLSNDSNNIHSYDHVLLPDYHVLSHSLLYYGGMDAGTNARRMEGSKCSHVLAARPINIFGNVGKAANSGSGGTGIKTAVRWFMRLKAPNADPASIPLNVKYSYQLSVLRPYISDVSVVPIDIAAVSLVGNDEQDDDDVDSSGMDEKEHRRRRILLDSPVALTQWREFVVELPTWMSANDVLLLSNRTRQCVYVEHLIEEQSKSSGVSVGGEEVNEIQQQTHLEIREFEFIVVKSHAPHQQTERQRTDYSSTSDGLSSVLISTLDVFSTASVHKENRRETDKIMLLPVNVIHNSTVY